MARRKGGNLMALIFLRTKGAEELAMQGTLSFCSGLLSGVLHAAVSAVTRMVGRKGDVE